MKIGVNKNKELREPQRQNSSKSGLSCGSRAKVATFHVGLTQKDYDGLKKKEDDVIYYTLDKRTPD